MHRHLTALILGVLFIAAPVRALTLSELVNFLIISGFISPDKVELAQQTVKTLEAQQSEAPQLTRNLYLGTKGNDVASLQRFLQATGDFTYPDITTYYGPATAAAVQRYQCRELKICSGSAEGNGYGVVGPRTRTHITTHRTTTGPVTNELPKQTPPTITPTPPAGGGGTTPQPPVTTPTPPTPANCTFNGATVTHGSSVTAYQTANVSAGQSCAHEIRTCTNGVLSGSYGYANCVVSAAPVRTITVSGPATVAVTAEIPCSTGSATCVDTGRRIDANVSTIVRGATRYWLHVNSSFMAKLVGTLDHIFQSIVWTKPTNEVFGEDAITDPTIIRDKKWVINTYQTSDGILGFVHIEREEGAAGADGQGRVGLAWSTNDGDTFTYLGNIIVPYLDPQRINVAGVPYVIKDGYFYIYYIDLCTGGLSTTVARAPVADVLAAARAGKTSAWKKYRDGAWGSIGIGGNCSPLFPTTEGVVHSDAAYSTYTGKYYLLLNKSTDGQRDTTVKLYESSDAVHWSLAKVVADEPASAVEFGYAYTSIVSTDASVPDTNTVGRTFYVYASKDAAAGPSALAHGMMVRWFVDLDGGTSVQPLPSCTLSVSPSVAHAGDTLTLAWTSHDATSMTVSGIGAVSPISGGSRSLAAGGSKTYIGSATGLGGTTACSASMSVRSAFPADFSGTQGVYGWRYQSFDGGTYADLSWDAASERWKGGEQYLLVGNGFMHPGVSGDAALTWVAPVAGTVSISGKAADGNGSCGDGVAVRIRNGQQDLWSSTIANGNSAGTTYNLAVSVLAGDQLHFITNANGTNSCDTTNWSPTITYQ